MAKSRKSKVTATPKTAISVTAGKVPGSLLTFKVEANEPQTVISVLRKAAELIGQQKQLGRPAFEINTQEYEGRNSNTKVDVPFKNGEALARKEKGRGGSTRWTNILWDTEVKDGDKVTLVPKVQGNM